MCLAQGREREEAPTLCSSKHFFARVRQNVQSPVRGKIKGTNFIRLKLCNSNSKCAKEYLQE